MELATQVQPRPLEKTFVDMFMDTLQGSYHENMKGSTSSSLSDSVMMEEHIKSTLKSGKIQDALSIPTGEKESPNNF